MAVYRLVQAGYAVLIGVAGVLLLPFLSVGLYSSPMTDDFCISSLSMRISLATVWNYYLHASGRLPALALIAIPSAVVRATGLDLYAVYPIIIIFAIVAFLVSMTAASAMLLRTDNRWISALFGLLLAAFTLGLLPSLGEFIYWVTGAACYLTATIGAVLLTAWCTKQVLNREHIDRPSLGAILALCFVTAMFNEFTVFFLIGIVVWSLLVRLFFMQEKAQIGIHLAMIGASIIGYCVILFSPGNVARIAQFSRSGNIQASIQNASTYTVEYATAVAQLPVVHSFAILTACFAVATSRPLRPWQTLQYVVFAIGLLCLAALWAYTSYFIGAYSTGDVLALRARDEVVAVALLISAISIILAVQAFVGTALGLINARLPAVGIRVLSLLIVAFGTGYSEPIRHAPNYETLMTEWPQFSIFWQENIARNALLSTTSPSDIVVPRRTVVPSLLMGDELRETPSQLPNDCITRYYGKRSVVLAPRTD